MRETEYHLKEARMLLVTMKAETEAGEQARAEIIAVIKAWRRGRHLPGEQTPILNSLYSELGF
jgi:hypothetical protein